MIVNLRVCHPLLFVEVNARTIDQARLVLRPSHLNVSSQAPDLWSLRESTPHFVGISICSVSSFFPILSSVEYQHIHSNTNSDQENKTNTPLHKKSYQQSPCLHALAALMLPLRDAQAVAPAAVIRYTRLLLAGEEPINIDKHYYSTDCLTRSHLFTSSRV